MINAHVKNKRKLRMRSCRDEKTASAKKKQSEPRRNAPRWVGKISFNFFGVDIVSLNFYLSFLNLAPAENAILLPSAAFLSTWEIGLVSASDRLPGFSYVR